MDRKTLGIAGVVLALGALVHPGASGGRTEAPPVAADKGSILVADAPCDAAAEGPWKALDHFFRLKTPASKQSPFGVPSTPVQFLIALVPDPVSTHLALDFDRSLESIILAAGDFGFSFQRHWTPWRTAPEKEPALLTDRKCLESQAEERNKQPGLLAFQAWNGDSLLVFLVGESPTGGVNQDQLIAALGDIRGLSGLGDANMSARVVGPSFSGSLRSLAPQVNAFWNVNFHFVSGMVTAEQEVATFKAEIRPQDQYESTVEGDQRAAKLFFEYATTRWHRKARMVLLSEGGTTYGRSLDLPGGVDGLDIRYPREISRLRNAYQEEKAPALKSGSAGAETAPTVPFSMKDAGPDNGGESHKDGMPAFSPLQSPASQQAVLDGIAATVRRERADFVGIVATDVLDEVFLSRFLRSSCPDTRLFTTDADVLFTAQPDGESLEGLLSVTTYPLFSRNQLWTSGSGADRRIPFASRYAEGIYNASRHLLNDKAALIEYTRPGKGTDRPPLWLTVMGRDGYWPLALLDEQQQDSSKSLLLKGPSQDGKPIYPESPGRGWYLSFWLCLIWSALHGAYLRFVFRGKPKPGFRGVFCVMASKWLFPAYPEPGDEISGNLRVFLTAATLSMGCAAVILDAPLWVFTGYSISVLWVDVYAGLGSIVALALFGIAVKLCRKPSIWRPWSNAATLAVGLWILAVTTVAVWVSLVAATTYRTGYFFAYRCFALTSGVAPNIPILLLAIALYYWSLMQLRRERNVEGKPDPESPPKPSSPRDARNRVRVFSVVIRVPDYLRLQICDGYSELPGDALMRRVDTAFQGLFSRVVWLPALLFLLVCVLLFVPWRTLRSFELERYDWLLVFVLATVYWATAVTWMQFVWCWIEFRAFLQWLETHPMRSAFSRLPKEISWVPLVRNPPERALFVSTRACDCLQALVTFDSSTVKAPNALEKLKLDIGSEAQEIAGLFGEIDKEHVEVIDPVKYDKLQANLHAVAVKIVADLQATSWQEGDSDSLDAEREKHTKKKKRLAPDDALVILKEEFVAFRYLMFIRQVFRDLRNLLGFIIGGFILAVISLSSYTFQGHRWIGVASAIALLAIGTGVAVVLAGMDRDAILSRISATKPDEVGATFYLRLAQFGALPLLTLVASQFPALNHFLFSWVQPALESLK